jgi:hypothetical protein
MSHHTDPDRFVPSDAPYEANFPEFPPGHPDDGKRVGMEADLTVYWPRVRPCWEETP